ncbi:MAG: methionyl-tRNA formyltransferase [Prevotella sp.]|nr:methionyl-tRNA formyltransferase [Prevotella sp.]
MKKEDLRIVFMGTPEFAVETLRALVENEYNVVAVVTQPDKPVGRHGSVLQPSAVKQYAVEQGLPVLQPEKMKDPAFVEQLRSYDANLQVVVAFRMLPEVVWAMPEYGTFNVHAALLPQYRGAAPINWAVINGETETGVTTFFLDHDIDTGRIIMKKPFAIPDDADVEYVYDGLMHLGAQICLETLEAIVAADGHPVTVAQESLLDMKPAPKIFKETCEIKWSLTAKQVYDFVRGLSPVPGAWTTLVGPDGKETVLKIYKTRKTGIGRAGQETGQVSVDGKALFIAASDELLELLELQLAGKKRMAARDFLNGMKDMGSFRVK